MRSPLRTILFVGSLLLYVTIQFLRAYIKLPIFINSYLTDFLALPIILCMGLFLLWRFKRFKDQLMPLYVILLIAAYWSIYFEWFLPGRSDLYTADFIDAVMYFAGGFFFYIWQKSTYQEALASGKAEG